MAEPNQISTSSTTIRDNGGSSSGASASSSTNSTSGYPQVREEEVEQQRNQQFEASYRGNWFTFNEASTIRDDSWSCVIVVLTFWFFVSMTLILGVYGTVSLTLGPNCSVLIQPNPIFVRSIKVRELDGTNPGLMLYSFYKPPSLDVVKTWSKNRNLSVPVDSHKELIYFLNKGSQINISYTVNTPSSSVFLVIAQGNEDLAQWLEDPTYPNTTLSWNVIRGSGIVKQKIWKSSSYYVAVGNLNTEEVEVQLNITIRALLYNTTEAFYKCNFTNGLCSLSILFPTGNTAVVTSRNVEQDSPSDEWYVNISYGPRWAIYIVGIAGMTVLMLVAFYYLNNFRALHEEGTTVQYAGADSQRAPLLSHKDDDASSWGSSYDSVSNDEEDLEDFLAAGSLEGTSSRDGENGNNTRRLCAICFDAPRDCFFLPCGHCVACFDCGTRIAEAAGTCPICRRTMKKVRKIFTV